MLAIPRVQTYCGCNLKKAVLSMEILVVIIIIVSPIEALITKSLSIKSIAIVSAHEVLPLLATISCIYGILKNKPKFILPRLYLLFAFVLFLTNFVIGSAWLISNVFKLEEVLSQYDLAFLIWLISIPITAFTIYNFIALHSLYMLMIEGRLDRNRNNLMQAI